MLYIVDLDEGKIFPYGTGVALSDEEARRAARAIADHFGVTEGIPLQDPAEPAYAPYTKSPPGVCPPVDPTAWEDDPPPPDDLTSPAKPA